jgi:hypothetical protein
MSTDVKSVIANFPHSAVSDSITIPNYDVSPRYRTIPMTRKETFQAHINAHLVMQNALATFSIYLSFFLLFKYNFNYER